MLLMTVFDIIKLTNTGMLAVNVTAAFDTVDHGILLKQMKSIGICESALAWIAFLLVGQNTRC